MKIRVILQARTDSARLPGKSLLPVSGIPLAVLAALRAANSGLEVLLATTNRSLDDELAQLVSDAGLLVYRGSTYDVRKRFVDACVDLADDAIIVRLTGDNVVPDGQLIEDFLDHFVRSGQSFASTRGGFLPFGVTLEAMRLGIFRESLDWTDNQYALEHVTPAMYERLNCFIPPIIHPDGDLSRYRCTVDTFYDYLIIQKLFSLTNSPITISWQKLVTLLVDRVAREDGLRSKPRLRLGTAQLTAPYGSKRKTIQPTPQVAHQIIRRIFSCEHGIDTARAYLGAEEQIGSSLSAEEIPRLDLVSKMDPFQDLQPNADPSFVAKLAKQSILQSLAATKHPAIKILLHRAEHLTLWDGAIWNQLKNFREDNLISTIGVSVQSPNEAKIVLADPDVKIIQIPFNILDHRWDDSGVVSLLGSRSDVEVHVRSVFLQGILLREKDAWPKLFDNYDEIVKVFRQLVKDLKRINIADLCIAYVRGHGQMYDWINDLVIGMESLEQLEQNLSLFEQPVLTESEICFVRANIPISNEIILNPAEMMKNELQ